MKFMPFIQSTQPLFKDKEGMRGQVGQEKCGEGGNKKDKRLKLKQGEADRKPGGRGRGTQKITISDVPGAGKEWISNLGREVSLSLNLGAIRTSRSGLLDSDSWASVSSSSHYHKYLASPVFVAVIFPPVYHRSRVGSSLDQSKPALQIAKPIFQP